MVREKCTLKKQTLHFQDNLKMVNFMVQIVFMKQQDILMWVILLMERKTEKVSYYKSLHCYKVLKDA